MTRSLALEWGTYGICVTGIAPGPIKGTPGMTKLAPNITDDMVDEILKDGIPLKRAGTKTEVAAIALFLISMAGNYITGHTVVVDGGQWLHSEAQLPREMVASRSRAIETQSRGVGLPQSKV